MRPVSNALTSAEMRLINFLSVGCVISKIFLEDFLPLLTKPHGIMAVIRTCDNQGIQLC